MIYTQTQKRFRWSTVLLPFVAILLLIIIVSNCYDKRQAKRAKQAENESLNSTISVLESLEKNINREIINHYEKIDSLVHVRDSVVSEHSTKTVLRLQYEVDSIFNRQLNISHETGSGKGITK